MAQVRGVGSLAAAQTGNADSTNVRVKEDNRPYALRITSTVGATPTVTLNIKGSPDGVTYYNIPYALVATPSTFVVDAIVITTAVTTFYLLQMDQAWQYIKTVTTLNTNVTLTTDLL